MSKINITQNAKGLRNSEGDSVSSAIKHIRIKFEQEMQLDDPVQIAFILEHRGAERVYVCGDFNSWQPVSLGMVGMPEAGLWEKKLILQPGRYEYKFIVDDEWIHDPDARKNVPNVFGTLNSVVDVEPKSNFASKENP